MSDFHTFKLSLSHFLMKQAADTGHAKLAADWPNNNGNPWRFRELSGSNAHRLLSLFGK